MNRFSVSLSNLFGVVVTAVGFLLFFGKVFDFPPRRKIRLKNPLEFTSFYAVENQICHQNYMNYSTLSVGEPVNQISAVELECLVSLLNDAKPSEFSKIMNTLIHLSNYNLTMVFLP